MSFGGIVRAVTVAGVLAAPFAVAAPAHATGNKPSTTVLSMEDGYLAGDRPARVAALNANPVPGEASYPTGTVEIREGSHSFGTVDAYLAPGAPLNYNANLAAIPAGTHTFTATYSGDATFAPSSTTTTITVRKRTAVATATTSIGRNSLDCGPGAFATPCPPGTAPQGTSVTFATTVGDLGGQEPNAHPAPSGVVTFTNRGTGAVLGHASLTDGHASITTSSLPVGRVDLQVDYPGDGFFAPAASNMMATVTILSPGSAADTGTGAGAGTVGSNASSGTASSRSSSPSNASSVTGLAARSSSTSAASTDTSSTDAAHATGDGNVEALATGQATTVDGSRLASSGHSPRGALTDPRRSRATPWALATLAALLLAAVTGYGVLTGRTIRHRS